MYYTIRADHTGNRYVRQFQGGIQDLRRIFEHVYKIPVKVIYPISEREYYANKKD